MENEPSSEESKIMTYEDIINKGESIYPISEDMAKKSFDVNNIKSWPEIFYALKPEKSLKKFNELVSKSEHSKFFEGLNYEFGINNKPQDIQKSLSLYKEGAEKGIDAMCMYKLYHIYKTDFLKFNIPKRNRVFEKFYLFKTFSFLNYQQLQRMSFLCNRFDIPLEVVFQFDQEDSNFDKFKNFLIFLKKYYKELNLSLKDINIIEATFSYKFGNGANTNSAIKLLLSLIPEENANNINDIYDLEIYYKVASYLYSMKDYSNAESYYKFLINAKYERAFPDYAIFLFEHKGEGNKALILSKIASETGFYIGNNIHYNVFFSLFNFEHLNNKDDINLNKFLKVLMDILVNNFILDDINAYFDYFYFLKILKKYKYTDLIKQYDGYTKEFVQYIININELNTNNNNEEDNEYIIGDYQKEKILQYFQRNEYYSEFNLIYGILLYYGVDNILEKNYLKSLEKLKIAYNNTHSKSYKRFCYTYIFKVRRKLNEKKLINPKNKSLYVSDNKLLKTKKKLFLMHKSCIEEENVSNLSSSFFYSIAKLFKYKIGNDGDPLLEFICLERAVEWDIDNLIQGSIICFYRRTKAKKLLENDKKYESVLKGIKGIKDSEGYGEDNSLCPICFDKKRNILCLPCKHLFCENCIKQIMSKRKCPICRGGIIMIYHVQFIDKKEGNDKDKKEENNKIEDNKINKNEETNKDKNKENNKDKIE